jgi:3-methyladenine DNA glycosylase/8-oxoguanine DNA glycosylase
VTRAFEVEVPSDYVLSRDLCSYGYFLLWPNHWDPAAQVYTRALELTSGPVLLRVSQGTPGARPRRGTSLSVVPSRTLSAGDRAEIRAAVSRILRLDEPASEIKAFHVVDPRWKASGRGRLMRSPTLFEDLVKSVTSCNVQWPSTVTMNKRLCEVAGARVSASGPVTHTFPNARKLARMSPGTLRARCRTGYRDGRIVELAKQFARGEVDPAWFEDPATSDDAVWEALLELPGIGPYAAANVMQLLGRYARLPLDSESIRHGKAVLGMTGTDRAIMRAIHEHFAPFGRHAFRSYWFEIWEFYERKRGPAWMWERDTTGKTFTAAQLK